MPSANPRYREGALDRWADVPEEERRRNTEAARAAAKSNKERLAALEAQFAALSAEVTHLRQRVAA